MSKTSSGIQINSDHLSLSTKLWIYTNYDCNLKCSYCVAESHPNASKRRIQLSTVERIVDEAAVLHFESIFFTGGEPFILNNICKMLAYASSKLPTTVLTNAMLFQNRRFQELKEINNENIIVQVSLDGSLPEHHDPYRGNGSWKKTIIGIHMLLEAGFKIRLSTTETPANIEFIEEISRFCRSLGILENDHIIRPLAKRGFSDEGMEVGKFNLAPEMTINVDGVYWHPLSTDPDLLVRDKIFPLSKSIKKIQTELKEIIVSSKAEMEEFQ